MKVTVRFKGNKDKPYTGIKNVDCVGGSLRLHDGSEVTTLDMERVNSFSVDEN